MKMRCEQQIRARDSPDRRIARLTWVRISTSATPIFDGLCNYAAAAVEVKGNADQMGVDQERDKRTGASHFEELTQKVPFVTVWLLVATRPLSLVSSA